MNSKQIEEQSGMPRANIRCDDQPPAPQPTAYGPPLPNGWQEVKGLAGRRFLARRLDLMLYQFLAALVLYGWLQLWPLVDPLANELLSFLPFGMMLVLEPLLLRLFRTTPGKWMMGLRLEWQGGRRFDYSEGLIRTWGVFTGGMGANIPVLSQWRCWRSYQDAWNGGNSWQEYGERYLVKDEKRWRVIAGILLWVMLLAGGLLVTLNGLMPRYRSADGVTAQQFANNFNRYSDRLEYGFQTLLEDGSWRQKNDVVIHIDGERYDPNKEPQFVLESGADGLVHRIAYQWQSDGAWASPPNAALNLAMLSYTAAQPQASLWQVVVQNALYGHLEEKGLENYTFESCGVRLTYRVENHGYCIIDGADPLLFLQDGYEGEPYLCGEFVLEKLP